MDDKKKQQLNRQIAELLGYTVNFNRERGWSLIKPDGTEWEEDTLEAHSGSGDEYSVWQLIPDYEHDFNAFLHAIDGKDCLVKFQPDLPVTVTIYDTGWYMYTGGHKYFVASETDAGVADADATVQCCAARALRDWLQWEKTAYDEVTP